MILLTTLSQREASTFEGFSAWQQLRGAKLCSRYYLSIPESLHYPHWPREFLDHRVGGCSLSQELQDASTDHV